MGSSACRVDRRIGRILERFLPFNGSRSGADGIWNDCSVRTDCVVSFLTA